MTNYINYAQTTNFKSLQLSQSGTTTVLVNLLRAQLFFNLYNSMDIAEV